MKKRLLPILLFLVCIPFVYPARIRGPLVVSDRWPECTTLQTWARDAFRLDGVSNGTERDRAISLFKWLRLFNRLSEGVGGMAHAVEGPWGEEAFVRDAHKHLFVYGWGHCATHSLIAEALWQEYTGDPLSADRVIVMHEDGGYHTMYRLRLDGKFGAFDARYGYYLIENDAPDARILDWEGVGDDRNIYANRSFKNRCRPFFEFPQTEFERGLWVKPKPVFESEAAWRAAGTEPEVVFRDRQYQMGTRFHDMNFELVRGMTIERRWDNSLHAWYIPKKEESAFLESGRFYRVGESMVGGDGEKNDPNFKLMEPYFTTVPSGQGYPTYLEGDRSLGQAAGLISYRPDLRRGDLTDARISGEGLVSASESPFLRPASDNGSGELVLEFYSPYVLVGGRLQGRLVAGPGDSVEAAFRSQVPKPGNEGEPDRWLEWNAIAARAGSFAVELDRVDAAEGKSSFHGAYRFQIRFRFKAAGSAARVGLSDFTFNAAFENGIMSIPQVFAGENTIRFKVEDRSQVDQEIVVTYRWQNADGSESSNTKRIQPALFYEGNEAVYRFDAPEFRRCLSLTIAVP